MEISRIRVRFHRDTRPWYHPRIMPSAMGEVARLGQPWLPEAIKRKEHVWRDDRRSILVISML